MDKTPVIEKLKKVLALTTSPDEGEAAAAAAMAARLMDEYNLTMLDVNNLQPDSDVVDVVVSDGWQYRAWEIKLYANLSELYDCSIYTSRKYDHKVGSDGRVATILHSTRIKIIGFKSDVEILGYVYNYLHKVIADHITAVKKRLKGMGLTRDQKKCNTYIHNYSYGMIDSICQTIRNSRQQYQDTHEKSRVLVVAKAAAVDSFVQQKKMRIHRIRSCGDSGYQHGYIDGSGVNVTTAINGQSDENLAIGSQYA